MIINYKDMPENFCNVSSNDIIELEPCPFCGSRAYLNYDVRRRNYGHCGKCHADGGGHWDEKEAIKLWNNRAYSEEEMTNYEKERILNALNYKDKNGKERI